MELVDEIMEHIGDYVTDQFAVSNSIYIILDKYDVKKKSTEIVKYKADTNEMLIKKFLNVSFVHIVCYNNTILVNETVTRDSFNIV